MCSVGENDSEWFYLINKSSGFVLEETGHENPLVLRSKSGSDGQLWKKVVNHASGVNPAFGVEWKKDGCSLVSKRNITINREDMLNPNGRWEDGAKVNGIKFDKENSHFHNQQWRFENERIFFVDVRADWDFDFSLEMGHGVFASHTPEGKEQQRRPQQFWSQSFANIDKYLKIEILPSDSYQVREGSTAYFQCNVIVGDPEPSITWSRADGRPFSGNTEDDGIGTLVIKNAGQADAGYYKCVAINAFASIKDEARLLIKFEWFYIQYEKNGKVIEATEEGGKLKLTKLSTIDGQPDNSGQLWKQKGDSIVSKNNLAITLQGQIDDGEIIGSKPKDNITQMWRFVNTGVVGLKLLEDYQLDVHDDHVIHSRNLRAALGSALGSAVGLGPVWKRGFVN